MEHIWDYILFCDEVSIEASKLTRYTTSDRINKDSRLYKRTFVKSLKTKVYKNNEVETD